ncbi:GNAT family N-acetyltransferase [Rhizobium sp. LjRoot30]|uniref:GNAT family N-acetyltransferase n=1 Tax=Rhizobium sp. LjRoot30 TaxID=3342320 RepID=UPI003F502D38
MTSEKFPRARPREAGIVLCLTDCFDCVPDTMLSLVPFIVAHFPFLLDWFQTHADLVQWGGPMLDSPLSRAQSDGMLEGDRSDPPARLCRMAETGRELVGHLQLVFDWRNGNALLSHVAIAPQMRGRGLAGPMTDMAVDEALCLTAIERLELNVHTWNAPAIRTYQRSDFTLGGVGRAPRWSTASVEMRP